ncbi:hypothetical protein bhYOR_001442 (plasmid) [Borrelia nietonii YOR]|uniref:hypothetical protein n=1 Tax=Borrelia nietonii TaxID=3117462 RepID=UPI0012D2B755|nr:hypothetical protein [Borrelia nietonii]UPA10072.1 hypothetical protein bhYOR_001442 [Borrelia nietonii YOR]
MTSAIIVAILALSAPIAFAFLLVPISTFSLVTPASLVREPISCLKTSPVPLIVSLTASMLLLSAFFA